VVGQIAHADWMRRSTGQHSVHGAGDFLERLHASGHLAERDALLSVNGWPSRPSCGEAAHAAILFVELAVDFHDLAGRFWQPAKIPPQMVACARVRALTMSPDLVMPPSPTG